MAKGINKDDIDKFHDSSIHIPTRTIYMGSEAFYEDGSESGCDGHMAERFVKNMHILGAASSDPITVLMNNVGGDEYHGFAMFDAITTSKCQVKVVVMGHAMSMGSIILQAADERVMSPSSRQMIHYGTWGVNDHAKTAQKWAQEGLKIDKWMEKMYLARINEKLPEFTLAELKALLDHDTFYSAQEWVAMGLADKVLNSAK